ncbi:MAG TPA: hypothetical protein PK668_22050 [Myxococcota bacterium]|nr:hypothetical protein [Myxococcota bacterium]HRY96341.1 hypothetical protein [Myxococcota bacterium]
MLTFYLACVVVGVVFSVASFILSGGFESHVEAGADAGADAGHADGDNAGGDTGAGEVHFPLFSPVVIASFVSFFGVGGVIGLKVFFLVPVLSVLVALACGVGIGLLVGWLLMKIYKHLQSNAVARVRNLVGALAEVTEPIAASGVGEISFDGPAQRMNGPARSEDKRDIKRHALVTITRVVGGLYYVREHTDEKLRDVPASDKPA